MALSPADERAAAALQALEGRSSRGSAGDLERTGMKLGLERITGLLDVLGNPHQGLEGVLVAGTNGKGSVCALVDSMARAAGLRTVMMTKPHLVSWTERITLNGQPITDAALADLIDRVIDAADRMPAELGRPSVFEVLTAAGILTARAEQPDILVTEVGLGGRLDSTNVLDLGVAVVTGIALDHRAELGDDIDGIAAEKAAIIKAGNDVVTGAVGSPLAVIRQRAAQAGARSFVALGEDLAISGEEHGRAGVSAAIGTPPLRVATPLIGGFQVHNLGVAVAACRALSRRGRDIPDDAIVAGGAAVHWPGRMQWLDGAPALLIDGGHNPAAVAAMAEAAAPLCRGRRTVAVFGAMADKDVGPMLTALRGLTGEVVFTQPASPRAVPAAELAGRWGGPSSSAPSVAEALTTARSLAGPDGVVVACGSLYLAGEALQAATVLGWGGGSERPVPRRPGPRRAWP